MTFGRSVTTAVIPAAGLGTRMAAVSGGVPKELLPIGARPAIDYSVREALAAGLNRIVVILNSRKELIAQHLRRQFNDSEAQFVFVNQEQPRGLGDALLLVESEIGGEAFALIIPDNLFVSPAYSFGRFLDIYRQKDCDIVGVVQLDAGDAARWGNCGQIDYEGIGPDLLHIRKLHDKGTGTIRVAASHPKILRACGRYICKPHLFDTLRTMRPDGIEFSEIPAYQKIAEQRRLLGLLLPGPVFDVGIPSGYLAAQEHFSRVV